MSLTPEQERAEREAFWKYYHEQGGMDGDVRNLTTWLARAEVAATEREQLKLYVQHRPACPKGTVLPQFEYVCRCTCGLDAILAPREK